MIRLRFIDGDPLLSSVVEASSYFHLNGCELRREVETPVIATFAEPWWQAGPRRFQGFECYEPVLVNFEDPETEESHVVGSFNGVSMSKGVLRSRGGRELARLCEDGRWECLDKGTRWPILVLCVPGTDCTVMDDEKSKATV